MLYQQRGAAAWLLYSSPSRSWGSALRKVEGLPVRQWGAHRARGHIGKTWESVRRFLCLLCDRGAASAAVPAVPHFCRLFSPYTSRRLCGSLRGACRWGITSWVRALAALCACAGRSAGSIKQQHKKGAADSRGRRSVVQKFINCGSGSASAPTAWGCWCAFECTKSSERIGSDGVGLLGCLCGYTIGGSRTRPRSCRSSL